MGTGSRSPSGLDPPVSCSPVKGQRTWIVGHSQAAIKSADRRAPSMVNLVIARYAAQENTEFRSDFHSLVPISRANRKGRWMSAVPSESVLVVPTELLHQLGYFQGFMPDVEGYLETLLSPAHTSYQPRAAMEADPSFKQLIPYVIFCHAAVRRRTVGLSVHAWDRAGGTAAAPQAERGNRRSHLFGRCERQRAVRGRDAPRAGRRSHHQHSLPQKCVGLINDDETEVGKVHLGVVHIFDVENTHILPRESEIVDAGFVPADDLLGDLDGFESWSRICLESLFTK